MLDFQQKYLSLWSGLNSTCRENLEDLQQIVAQLENDRFIASRRAQRLEEELKSQEKVKMYLERVFCWLKLNGIQIQLSL